MTKLNKKYAVIPACIRRESKHLRRRFPLAIRGNSQKASRRRNSQYGFTALELLVAITIVFLLAAGSVAMISRIEVWANIAQAKTEIIQISMAIEMEKYDTGVYTLNLEDLKSPSAPAGINARTWKGPYLKGDFSLNDPWTTAYTLTRADGGSGTPVSAKIYYLITSFGVDKLPGGTDLDADIIWHSEYSGFQN
jgi:general secretion pathway protein G